eukprot:jgi/Mesen1/8454/ME000475S07705
MTDGCPLERGTDRWGLGESTEKHEAREQESTHRREEGEDQRVGQVLERAAGAVGSQSNATRALRAAAARGAGPRRWRQPRRQCRHKRRYGRSAQPSAPDSLGGPQGSGLRRRLKEKHNVVIATIWTARISRCRCEERARAHGGGETGTRRVGGKQRGERRLSVGLLSRKAHRGARWHLHKGGLKALDGDVDAVHAPKIRRRKAAARIARMEGSDKTEITNFNDQDICLHTYREGEGHAPDDLAVRDVDVRRREAPSARVTLGLSMKFWMLPAVTPSTSFCPFSESGRSENHKSGGRNSSRSGPSGRVPSTWGQLVENYPRGKRRERSSHPPTAKRSDVWPTVGSRARCQEHVIRARFLCSHGPNKPRQAARAAKADKHTTWQQQQEQQQQQEEEEQQKHQEQQPQQQQPSNRSLGQGRGEAREGPTWQKETQPPEHQAAARRPCTRQRNVTLELPMKYTPPTRVCPSNSKATSSVTLPSGTTPGGGKLPCPGRGAPAGSPGAPGLAPSVGGKLPAGLLAGPMGTGGEAADLTGGASGLLGDPGPRATGGGAGLLGPPGESGLAGAPGLPLGGSQRLPPGLLGGLIGTGGGSALTGGTSGLPGPGGILRAPGLLPGGGGELPAGLSNGTSETGGASGLLGKPAGLTTGPMETGGEAVNLTDGVPRLIGPPGESGIPGAPGLLPGGGCGMIAGLTGKSSGGAPGLLGTAGESWLEGLPGVAPGGDCGLPAGLFVVPSETGGGSAYLTGGNPGESGLAGSPGSLGLPPGGGCELPSELGGNPTRTGGEPPALTGGAPGLLGTPGNSGLSGMPGLPPDGGCRLPPGLLGKLTATGGGSATSTGGSSGESGLAGNPGAPVLPPGGGCELPSGLGGNPTRTGGEPPALTGGALGLLGTPGNSGLSGMPGLPPDGGCRLPPGLLGKLTATGGGSATSTGGSSGESGLAGNPGAPVAEVDCQQKRPEIPQRQAANLLSRQAAFRGFLAD